MYKNIGIFCIYVLCLDPPADTVENDSDANLASGDGKVVEGESTENLQAKSLKCDEYVLRLFTIL